MSLPLQPCTCEGVVEVQSCRHANSLFGIDLCTAAASHVHRQKKAL